MLEGWGNECGKEISSRRNVELAGVKECVKECAVFKKLSVCEGKA